MNIQRQTKFTSVCAPFRLNVPSVALHLGCCHLLKHDSISHASERNNAARQWRIYAPFCSPLQLRRFPGAPSLWTGLYCLSGRWSRQFWGGFCAHSVQNSCIHIKWINCTDIKRRWISSHSVSYFLLNWSICSWILSALRVTFIRGSSRSVLAGFVSMQWDSKAACLRQRCSACNWIKAPPRSSDVHSNALRRVTSWNDRLHKAFIGSK